MNGYDRIKALADETGAPTRNLLVMAKANDPFFAGSPTDVANNKWCADLFERFGFGTGAHLRRIHYQVVSQASPVLMPDHNPYQNTQTCWGYLCVASRAARTLGLVDAKTFADRRNAPPTVFRDEPIDVMPRVEIEPSYWHLPGIDADLWEPHLQAPDVAVHGYAYDDADQRYLIEIWVEKSTVNDVLLPVCRQFRANLVVSAGFQSITAAVSLIKRALATKRPARIFFISDHDPAGDKMPQAVARQIEFWINQYGLDVDIAVTPLVLTAAQVAEYGLPRIPIKDTDRRAANFEARRGEGAVEPDALEALHLASLAGSSARLSQDIGTRT
jgi:hypothetical protein